VGQPSLPADVVVTGDIESLSAVAHYPDPADDHLYIQGVDVDTRMSIVDMSGRAHRVESINEGNAIRMNVSALPAGLYIIHFASAEGSVTRKFLKR
jgi:hypothetical protein